MVISVVMGKNVVIPKNLNTEYIFILISMLTKPAI